MTQREAWQAYDDARAETDAAMAQLRAALGVKG